MQCICSVYAVFMQCLCSVYAVYMQCLCSVYAVFMQSEFKEEGHEKNLKTADVVELTLWIRRARGEEH